MTGIMLFKIKGMAFDYIIRFIQLPLYPSSYNCFMKNLDCYTGKDLPSQVAWFVWKSPFPLHRSSLFYLCIVALNKVLNMGENLTIGESQKASSGPLICCPVICLIQ